MRQSYFRYAVKILVLAVLAFMLAISFAPAHAAVTVSSFTAKAQTTQILVEWKTATELNNTGYNLLRATSLIGPFAQLNPTLIPTQCFMCPTGTSYSFTDSWVVKGQIYYYKLESVEATGSKQQFGPVNATISTPTPTSTTAAPTATRTPTTAATATTTATLVPATATASNTPIPGTPTPTVYSPPTPPGTLPPTSTPLPTRVAIFVDPSTNAPSTAAPQRARSNNAVTPTPQKSDAPLSIPTLASVVENPPPQISSPILDNPTDETASDSTPARSTERNPLLLALLFMAGLFAITLIAVGSVSFYFIARKYIR